MTKEDTKQRDKRLIRLFLGGIIGAFVLGTLMVLVVNPAAAGRIATVEGAAIIGGTALAVWRLSRALRSASKG